MKGFPRSFSTKGDYLNALKMYPEQTKKALRNLYNDRFIWKVSGTYTNKKDLVSDSTHRWTEGRDAGGKTVYTQTERVEDDHARYIRLGFTRNEITRLML